MKNTFSSTSSTTENLIQISTKLNHLAEEAKSVTSQESIQIENEFTKQLQVNLISNNQEITD